jgi:cysteinyl-tRNA synthetase
LKETLDAFIIDVLGLAPSKDKGADERIVPVMDLLLDIRQQARANRDFAISDKIRDGLAAAGIVVKDGKDGSSWN